MFLVNLDRFCGLGRGALGLVNPILSARNLSYGHLMKMEWWITDVIAVGSPNKSRKVQSLGGFLSFLANLGRF